MNTISSDTKIVPAVMLVAILGAGSLLVWQTAVRADREMRAELLLQTRLIAQTVNPARVQSLTGTAADLTNPQYQRLKEQLAAARSANPLCRFIYLMGRKPDPAALPDGGALFFLVDNEDPDSKDYSPPGQAYTDAPTACLRVFATRVAEVEGPSTDRWGTWITGHVPILAPLSKTTPRAAANGGQPTHADRHPEPGTVLAVLGMDVDARHWHQQQIRAALPPALLTLALAAILWLGTLLLRWRARHRGVLARWMRHLEPALAMAVGLVLTLFATWLTWDRQLHERKETFEQLADNRTEMVATKLHALQRSELEALASFYEHNVDVTPTEFQNFADYLTENPAVHAWQWIPAVAAADKSRFEAQARAAGLQGFEIWQNDARGMRVPATGRDVYYPVLRVAPLADNESLLGYDLGAEPLRRAAMEQAALTGLVTASAPATLSATGNGPKNMVVCRPVFAHDDRHRLIGFALAVLRMESLLRDTVPNSTTIVNLALLHGNAPPEALATDRDSANLPGIDLSLTRPVFAFGQVIAITAQAGPDFGRVHPLHASWLVALSGLGFTAGLVMVFNLLIRRREKLERLVIARTHELRENQNVIQLSEQRAHQQRIAIARLAVDEAFVNGNEPAALGRLTEDVAAVMQVERASVWMLSEDLQSLRCAALFESSTRHHSEGTLLQSKDYPRYFEAIRSERQIRANDAHADPRTSEFTASYLLPLGITSMLDAGIQVDGNLIGILCFEHVGGPRAWHSDEEAFAATAASLVAQMLANAVRRQTEAALRDSEARMRAITDSAQDAILMMDPAGQLSYWNPAAERILGYTSREAIGNNLHELLAPSHYHAAHRAAFPRFQLTGEGEIVGKTLDLTAIRKDGSQIPIQLSLSGVPIDGSWHAVGILRDITAQKHAELALLNTNRDLHHASARATEMAMKAEQANVTKSEFLANMSHEIRTPMNGIIGMTGLLLDSDLSDEQRRYAETVNASGESLLNLINDILDFSKIEAGKLELEAVDFDLSTVLEDFADVVALQAVEKNLEFICAAAPEVPPHLRGDPGRLRQVLLNLAGNAIKFTQRGEVVVRAALASVTDDDIVVRFSVRDTGIGIQSDKQANLFQKFSQVDASTTRHYGGSGLGLAISKQLAHLMGGEIGVISEVGQGSEFWFTAHFARPEGPLPVLHQPSNMYGHHILVVDDNATNREVLTTQLRAWGMRVEEAPDGPAALKELVRASQAGDPFRTAILDMQMPGMDGISLGLAIRADAAVKAMRLLLLTSLGQPSSSQALTDVGFASCLTKPARKSDLLRSLLTRTPSAMPQALPRLIHNAQGGTFRILLAEDNITNQKVAAALLKKLGLRADAVANGSEALHALETLPYDLVLMDVQMPEMDGLTATRIIRDPASSVRNRRIPVIAMTARAMQGDREICLEAGMDDYVVKPVTLQSLAKVLDRWLAPTAEHPQAAGTDDAPAP